MLPHFSRSKRVHISQKLFYDHATKGCFVYKLEAGQRAVDAIYIRKDALTAAGIQVAPAKITLTIEEARNG